MKQGFKAQGLSFGFSSVNSGQRAQTVVPQVIATSTEGGFRITPAVSSVLGIGSSNYVMFITNIANIDNAIRENDPAIVEFCEEQGLALGSPEAFIAVHKAFDMFGIAKGVAEYDAKGNVKETQERLSKNDRTKYVSQNFDSMLEAALASDSEELKDALTRDGITREEQIDILCPYVQAKTLPKYKGSKTANPAGLSGTGISLQFTDSNVWKQLKADLGEEATKVNRIFDVDVENIQTISIDNGYETVNVKALILGDYTDKEPARIGSGGESED